MQKSKFQFENPELKELTFKCNNNFVEEKFNGMSLKTEVNVERYEKENLAQVTLVVKIGDDTEKYPFCCEIVIGACFNWSINIDENKLEKLLKYNAPAALLSYVRPTVANLSSQAGFPPFNIPMINFAESK